MHKINEEMAQGVDNMRQWFEGIRDEYVTHANTATRIGTAFLMLLNYMADPDAPFLRKDQEDSTAFLLRLLNGAVVGNNRIRLNPDGSINCERINVTGSAIFNELVINHQNVLEGDTYFSDKGIIERVTYVGSNQYVLLMRKEYENDIVTFHAYDVLRCSMNRLDRARTWKTSWMRVDSVDTTANTMTVTLYDNEDVPGGLNFVPEQAARVVRWGNQIDPARQQTWFVSSTDGRFVFLQGVTQPILRDYNYAAFFGLPPDLAFLRDQPVDTQHPALFAKTLIAQNIITVDYEGNPEFKPRDRGFWQSTVQYIRGYDAEAQGWYVDRVWWGGCLWQAAVDLPTVGREPRFNNADWVCLLGGSNMYIEIFSTAGDFFPAGKPWQTTLVAEVWNAEMRVEELEIGSQYISWQRISSDRQGDIAWNIQHATGEQGLRLDIDSTVDVPGTWEAGSQISFQIDISLPELPEVLSARYSIIM